jgi:heat shock protein HtpX
MRVLEELLMKFAKRLLLFLGLNILIVTTISVILAVCHVQPYLTRYGLDLPSLVVFCLIYGMTGSLISLALSRAVAKWIYGVKLIDRSTCTQREKWLLERVHSYARRCGLELPEVGIYQSEEANAFATGPCKSRALVAVSSGLFNLMNDEEIEGVIGHEISHIVNDDMVTMTLLQGVVNAFVMFLSRVIAYAIARGSKDSQGSYFLLRFVIEIALLILGALLIATYSRKRECRADDGGAQLAGREKMVHALEALQRTFGKVDPKAQPALQAMKISSTPRGIWQSLFATHPPLEERIERLRQRR